MKSKIILGIFVLLVSTIMLMSNALGSGGPPFWANQATLSTPDYNPSQDPENSGYGTIQAVVWEELNQFGDWDIYMKYSLANGGPGSWVFPLLHPATTSLDEINPAVAVTNINPQSGLTEIHVVYQRENTSVNGTWDIYHTWTNNFGVGWMPPVILDEVPANNAMDPAIVFTEDFSFPGPWRGMLVQFVWSEWNTTTGIYEIKYRAYYLDPLRNPMRNYIRATVVQGVLATGDCLYPEIASVDELANPGTYDYPFSIVWQEQIWLIPQQRFQWNIFYRDGTTTTNPPGPPVVAFTGAAGQLNPGNAVGDCYHPDIAATHNYLLPVTTYYFHVNWVYNIWVVGTFQIDTCFYTGLFPTPGFIRFAGSLNTAVGPGPFVLDNPTIASKLFNLAPPWQFETWMCWEDSSNPASPPDIWYRVGLSVGGVFGYTTAAAMVPYVQPGAPSEYNPELWNKNDAAWVFPPPTHLVFDMTQNQNVQEVEYIDP